jgi:hypothetical protein
MRFRNVRSNKYYIYVENRPTRKIIPDDIPATRRAIKEYILSIPGRLRMQSNEIEEQYRIPDNAIKYNYIERIAEEDDLYFNSYVSFIRDEVVKQREYEFRMLLYMRDAGFIYGGNIYALTEEKEELDQLRKNKLQAAKNRREEEENMLRNVAKINKEECENLKKKEKKTKEDYCKITKYRIQRRYKVENLPRWFIRAVKGKHIQYDNISICIHIEKK